MGRQEIGLLLCVAAALPVGNTCLPQQRNAVNGYGRMQKSCHLPNVGDEQVNVSPTEILLKQILELLRMLDANRKMGRICERMEVESL